MFMNPLRSSSSWNGFSIFSFQATREFIHVRLVTTVWKEVTPNLVPHSRTATANGARTSQTVWRVRRDTGVTKLVSLTIPSIHARSVNTVLKVKNPFGVRQVADAFCLVLLPRTIVNLVQQASIVRSARPITVVFRVKQELIVRTIWRTVQPLRKNVREDITVRKWLVTPTFVQVRIFIMKN